MKYEITATTFRHDDDHVVDLQDGAMIVGVNMRDGTCCEPSEMVVYIATPVLRVVND